MIRYPAPFAIAALLISGAAVAAPASAIPTAFAGMPPIEFRYYDVTGRDEHEIYAALQRRAMRRPDGSLASGLTAGSLQNHWRQETDRRGCHIRDARADLKLTVTLPRLTWADRLPPKALAWWADYRSKIERHEAGHARIAIDHAGDFAIAASGARCADIQRIAQQVVTRISTLQNDYDRLTRHGQQQDRAD